MMQPEEVQRLISRYLEGKCTPIEQAKIEAWYNEQAEHTLGTPSLPDDNVSQSAKRVWAAVSPPKPIVAWMGKHRWAVAAMALLCVSLGIHQMGPLHPGKQLVDVMPGGYRATLRIADGSLLSLDTSQAGIVMGEDLKYMDGKPVLSDVLLAQQELDTPGQTEATKWLELTTPPGGTYHLVLADGSKVWLNAGSSLIYPHRFTDSLREVKITGEAYFEIAKSAVPFRVRSKGQSLAVLGTAFNITAYADDDRITTTLVSGKVSVVNGQSLQRDDLQPGQQSIVYGKRTDVKQVDVSSFIGWKNGEFAFMDTELREVMNQLKRWYAIDVVYEGNLPPTPFYGNIRRDISLSKLLEAFNETGIDFSIKKYKNTNRLVVSPGRGHPGS